MSVNLAQSQTLNNGANVLVGPNTAGNVLLVYALYDGTSAGTISVSDSNGNSYTQLGYFTFATGGPQTSAVALFVAKNINAGSNTITLSNSQSSTGHFAVVAEYSGVDTTNPVSADQFQAYPFPPGTANLGATIATALNNDVVALFYQNRNCTGITLPGGFTSQQQIISGGDASGFSDATIATAGSATYTVSFTTAGATGGAIWAAALTAPVTLVSIAVTPANPSVNTGLLESFTATGTYSDGSTADVTSLSTWTSSDPTKATINSSTGVATTIAAGATTIQASVGAVSGSTTLTVTAITLTSIAISPTNPSIALGLQQQFSAIGTFSDSSTLDISASVLWASSAPSKATIAPGGLASSVATGSTTISASVGAINSNTETLTITAPTLLSIAITPTTATIASQGSTQQFNAIGTFTNGNSDITNSVSWASSNPSTATIASGGLAISGAHGSTTITATQDGITSNSATLTVTTEVVKTVVGSFQFANTARVKGSVTFTRRAYFDANHVQLLTDGEPVVAQLDSEGGFSVALGTYDDIVSVTPYAMVVKDVDGKFLMQRFVGFSGGGTHLFNDEPDQLDGTAFPPQYNETGLRPIQGSFGSQAANGTVIFRLSQQAVTTGGVQIVPSDVVVGLDGSGALPTNYLYLQGGLRPYTLYLVRILNAEGEEISSGTYSIPETSSSPSLVNLNDLSPSPTVPNIGYGFIPAIYWVATPWKR